MMFCFPDWRKGEGKHLVDKIDALDGFPSNGGVVEK